MSFIKKNINEELKESPTINRNTLGFFNEKETNQNTSEDIIE